MSANSEVAIKDFCYYLTPEYADTFWGKYIWLYQGKGELSLSSNSLNFIGNTYSVGIPLKNITSIETKTFSRFAKPFGLAIIVIKYFDNEKENTIQFIPMKSPFKPTWETNKLIANWVEKFEQVTELSERVKRPLQIPPPPSKIHLTIFKSIAGLYFLFILSMLVWVASTWITINKDYYKAPVIKEKVRIQNPSSKLLETLLKTDDFPNEWQWASITTQQPSEFPWEKEAIDSANVSLGAKAPQFLIFRHYVYVTQFIELYSSPITSEEQFKERIIFSDGDETSFTPKLNKIGQYNYALCSKGSDFYACDVSVGYEYVVYSFITTTPQSFGEQFTIDFLNTIIQVTDQRVKENLQ